MGDLPDEHRSPREISIAAAIALIRLRVMISTKGVRRVLDELGYEAVRAPASTTPRPPDAPTLTPSDAAAARNAEARATGRLVARTARLLPGTRRCLVQALATALLLQRQGQDHEVIVGAKPLEQGLIAHAWVVSGEAIVVGGGALSSLPALVVFRPRHRHRPRMTSHHGDDRSGRAA